jgi:hypothetical protein
MNNNNNGSAVTAAKRKTRHPSTSLHIKFLKKGVGYFINTYYFSRLDTAPNETSEVRRNM